MAHTGQRQEVVDIFSCLDDTVRKLNPQFADGDEFYIAEGGPEITSMQTRETYETSFSVVDHTLNEQLSDDTSVKSPSVQNLSGIGAAIVSRGSDRC
jgi:hypothetical protein